LKRFVLADRDGTLIVEKNYLHDPEQVFLVPGCAEALSQIREMGWGIVCVSNQAGVGRGYFPVEDVLAVNARVEELLNADGASIDHYYFCPDHPAAESTHRKPATGMASDAEIDFGLDLTQCVVVGDKICDIDLGHNIGGISVLVRTGYGHTEENDPACKPHFVIDSIADLPDILRNL
jgi:D-glycero-D-manno-heptose 1,7-bisphosphate phosphatase